MDNIVNWTNLYAEHNQPEGKGHPRPWRPTTREELYAYFGVVLYTGLVIEPRIEDYWGSLETHGVEHIIKKYISKTRYEQLDRFIRFSPPCDAYKDTFGRVDALSEHLRLLCHKYYSPGAHLAVDETIERFIGRAPEIVNIPSKPTPEGFKIWVLANQGYVLDWMWHAKGGNKGPVDLDTVFIQEEGFMKTQAVVLDLLTQRNSETDAVLYPPGKHVIWLDNLFCSVKLFKRLRDLGIGAAGTVQTIKTQREEEGEEEGNIVEEKEGKKTRKKKVSAEKFSLLLTDLKLVHTAQIPWGTLYGELSKGRTVMEFAWADAQVVLFMSTVHDGQSYVLRRRKRPAKTSTNAAQKRKPFGNNAVKEMDIPEFIDQYNLYMCGVDVADQLRSYYTT